MASPMRKTRPKSAAKRTNDFFNLLRELQLDEFYYALAENAGVRNLSGICDVTDEDLRKKVKMKDADIHILRERYRKEFPGASKKKKSAELGRSKSGILDIFKHKNPTQSKSTRVKSEPRKKTYASTVWYDDTDIQKMKQFRSKSVPENVFHHSTLNISKSTSNFRIYGREKVSLECTTTGVQYDYGDDEVFSNESDDNHKEKAELPSDGRKAKSLSRKFTKRSTKTSTSLSVSMQQTSASAPTGRGNCRPRKEVKKSNRPSHSQIPRGVHSGQHKQSQHQSQHIVVVSTGKRINVSGNFQTTTTKTAAPPPVPEKEKKQHQGNFSPDATSDHLDYEKMNTTGVFEGILPPGMKTGVSGSELEYEAMSLSGRYENLDAKSTALQPDHLVEDLLEGRHGYDEKMPKTEHRISQSLPDLIDTSATEQERSTLRQASSEEIQTQECTIVRKYENIPKEVEPEDIGLSEVQKHDYENMSIGEDHSEKSSESSIAVEYEGMYQRHGYENLHSAMETPGDEDADTLGHRGESSNGQTDHDYENMPSAQTDIDQKCSQVNNDDDEEEDGWPKHDYENLSNTRLSKTLPTTSNEEYRLHLGYLCPAGEIGSDDSDYSDVSDAEGEVIEEPPRVNNTLYVGSGWETGMFPRPKWCKMKCRHPKNQIDKQKLENQIATKAVISRNSVASGSTDYSYTTDEDLKSHDYINIDAMSSEETEDHCGGQFRPPYENTKESMEVCSSHTSPELKDSDSYKKDAKMSHSYENIPAECNDCSTSNKQRYKLPISPRKKNYRESPPIDITACTGGKTEQVGERRVQDSASAGLVRRSRPIDVSRLQQRRRRETSE